MLYYFYYFLFINYTKDEDKKGTQHCPATLHLLALSIAEAISYDNYSLMCKYMVNKVTEIEEEFGESIPLSWYGFLAKTLYSEMGIEVDFNAINCTPSNAYNYLLTVVVQHNTTEE